MKTRPLFTRMSCRSPSTWTSTCVPPSRSTTPLARSSPGWEADRARLTRAWLPAKRARRWRCHDGRSNRAERPMWASRRETMPYVEGRVVHDADSHIFEPPGYAEEYADPKMRQQLGEALETGEPPAFMDAALAKQKDPAFRAKDAEEIMLRKNHVALGAMLRDDRPAALAHLGLPSQ